MEPFPLQSAALLMIDDMADQRGKPTDNGEQDGAELLKLQIERNRAYRESHAADPSLGRALQVLRRWQAQRLAQTYADLLASERYRPAAEFFLTDLYGEKDFTKRDQEVERVYPSMVKVLPDAALHTIALAVEVHVLSAELDQALWEVLTGELGVKERITEAQYAEGYRRCANLAQRRRQVQLIRRVGDDLDAVVAKPMLYQVLKLARKPAQVAGFAELHDFLERGFGAFRHMGGAEEFLETIVSRETRLLERIFAGHPRPFGAD
ncbi:MAG TPA: hypothetical protein VLC55_00630 [Burkholderiales bacterium]|nr:hypothetical protein [Burkholderiales bacterium]